MESTQQYSQTGAATSVQSPFRRAFAAEWDIIENENKTIGFETIDWVPMTYTLTHAARCLTVDDLTDPSLTPALPLIDALRKVEWPESTLPVHPYSQSDVRLHTSAPLDSAEYSYAYCFHKDRFDIHVGDFISRGLTDGEFAQGLLSQMSKSSEMTGTIIAKAKQFTGGGGSRSKSQDGAQTLTEQA
ncbi:hypothetical protein EHS25_006036 [Saitozyma podzolica]|uniref:Uncharacterized protein n=1 Tax=Saitozyma podzolica TaxID=1890683 RepID=A0A427XTF7_9TREE|nr:hypothetical protein EHS25_006036 [Saitozyma podzolica]